GPSRASWRAKRAVAPPARPAAGDLRQGGAPAKPRPACPRPGGLDREPPPLCPENRGPPMIDRPAFLADAQKLVVKLEKDLPARCDDMPDVGQAVNAEYRRRRGAR